MPIRHDNTRFKSNRPIMLILTFGRSGDNHCAVASHDQSLDPLANIIGHISRVRVGDYDPSEVRVIGYKLFVRGSCIDDPSIVAVGDGPVPELVDLNSYTPDGIVRRSGVFTLTTDHVLTGDKIVLHDVYDYMPRHDDMIFRSITRNSGAVPCTVVHTDGVIAEIGRDQSSVALYNPQPPHHSIFALNVSSVLVSVSSEGVLSFRCAKNGSSQWTVCNVSEYGTVREIGQPPRHSYEVLVIFDIEDRVELRGIDLRDDDDDDYLEPAMSEVLAVGVYSINGFYKPRYPTHKNIKSAVD